MGTLYVQLRQLLYAEYFETRDGLSVDVHVLIYYFFCIQSDIS